MTATAVRRPRARSAFALTAGVVLTLAGCSSADDTAAGGTSAAAETTTAAASTSADGGAASSTADEGETAPMEASITIKDFAYGDPVTVAPGATITVTNEDSATHDALPKEGDGWTMKLLAQGETDTFTAPAEDGSYEMTCSVHPQMSGELIVQG